jgi:predicted metal-binding protein
MKLEKLFGGKLLTDGRCPICPKCAKKENKPCVYPKRRRSSLEAVGIHATNLCEEVLQHKISWYRKANKKIIEPEYMTAVNGFLTDANQPKEMIK